MLDIVTHGGKEMDKKISPVVAMPQRRERDCFLCRRRRGAI
jgi:hypothetical protein